MTLILTNNRTMKDILIINGPNLNLLGRRQPEIYGTTTLEDIACALADEFGDKANIRWFQSNSEGEIIDALHAAGYEQHTDAIILNAGAYTHTSLAIADAIAAIPVPVIEVHLSNIFAREDIRHRSLIAPFCRGSISGFGSNVYRLAVTAAIELTGSYNS